MSLDAVLSDLYSRMADTVVDRYPADKEHINPKMIRENNISLAGSITTLLTKEVE